MSPLDNILSFLKNVRLNGKGYEASCPVAGHGKGRGDLDPSLSVGEGEDGRVLLKCGAGCSTEDVVAAIGLKMSDLFPARVRGGVEPPQGAGKTAKPSLTIAEYATEKRLPESFLTDLGVEDVHYRGRPAVKIPYFDREGVASSVRFRLALHKSPEGADQRMVWRRGDKALPYGLWQLAKARKDGYVVIVEGESDAQTLWHHGILALGVPGASTFKSEWASHLDGIGQVYAVIEPDRGGEEFWKRLAASPLRERLWRVDLPDAEDVSAMHVADEGAFEEGFKDALEKAVAWLDLAESEQKERAREAWADCEELANSPDILAEFEKDLKACGVAGDAKAAKLMYLAVNSRHLSSKMLVNIVVKGLSSSGKSFIVEKVLGFYPKEAFHALSGMSERALAYGDEPLSHRFIYLAEDAGMNGEFQTYLIRTLLSEGRLRYVTVEKTPDGMRPRTIEREGPTGLIVTTTRLRLHPENETRMLGVYVDDRPDQTRLILEAMADEDREEPDLRRWHAHQVWIASGTTEVTVPYAKTLARMVPHTLGVRLRRDFGSILNLIRSHALLHRANRRLDGKGRVVAAVNDYAAVRELVADTVAETLDAAVPEEVRHTVAAVEKLHEEAKEPVTVKMVGEELKLSKMPAWTRVRKAIEGGFLHNLEERKGRPAQLVPGDPLPKDVEVLPTPERLAEKGF